MSTVLKNARVLIARELCKKDILIEDGRIFDIGDGLSGDEIIDLSQKIVLPGFIDTHTHGGGGHDVNLSSPEELMQISEFFAAQGTTLWLASILADTREHTLEIIENISLAAASEFGAKLFGIHLEGPFLSAQYKGAMPEHLLIDADIALVRQYQKAAKGSIKYITVAPEIRGVIPLIKDISPEIIVGIGHSGADFDTALSAIESGAVIATHTFNAMRPIHHHEIGIAGACLVSDIWCEAICDGLHLSVPALKLLIKTKGYDRIIAVTDSIMAAGLSDGDYKLGVNDVIVKNGDARLKNGDTRAGSTLTTARAIKNLVKFTGEPVAKMSQLMSENPAKALGIFDERGSIAKGKYADFAVLDDELCVAMTVREGHIVFQK